MNESCKSQTLKNMHKAANILDFNVFSRQKSELLIKIKNHLLTAKKPLIIFTPNAEQLVQAKQNPNFSRCLKQAHILIPDGISLVWASRWLAKADQSGVIAERIAGVDLVKDLIKLAQELNLKVLVIGGRGYEQVVPQAKKVKNYWQLTECLFWATGYQDVNQVQKNETDQLQQTMQELKPEVLLVAFGAPGQEEWIIGQLSLLTASRVKLVMAVGGAFDMLLGKTKRAPAWLQYLGLEWLFRLIQEPWRWRRQLRLIKFVSLVIKQKKIA